MEKRALIYALLIAGFLLVGLMPGVLGASVGNAFQPIADIFVSLITGVIDILKPILSLALGEYQDSELYFGKILIALLVFAVAYAVLDKIEIIKSKTWAHWMLAIVVGLLSARFLSEEMVSTAILPSSVLGVTLTAIIPLVVCFLLFEQISSRTLKRIAWVFFGVVFLALWAYRTGDGSLGQISYIYPATAILALLLAVFDGTLRRFLDGMKAERTLTDNEAKIRNDLYDVYHKINDRFVHGYITVANKASNLNELRPSYDRAKAMGFRDLEKLMDALGLAIKAIT